MSGVGLFIAALGRTEEQASGYQVTIILAMSAIGGAMIPSFVMPAAIRKSIAVVTPVHWAMQGFLNIFWRDQSLAGILPEVAMLLGMAARAGERFRADLPPPSAHRTGLSEDSSP